LKTFFYLLVVFLNTTLFSQDTIVIQYPLKPELLPEKLNDTIVINSPMDGTILFGTTLLPNTSNQVYLYGFGLYLQSMNGSECMNDMGKPESFADFVQNIDLTDTSLLVNIQISANCCHSFLGDASVVDDTIFQLIYYGYGAGYCACNCCFGLTYYFTREDYGREEFDRIRYVMINEDRNHLYPFRK
jgi:hypothetical protein